MDITTFTSQFAQLFENTDASLIHPDTVFRELEEWDSLIALSTIAMIDEQYGITLTGDEMRGATTVQQLFDLIVSKKS
jgi:acyl carrier protein